ncbi:Protein of unknown function [Gryllus bimaculatus]|nr:Protein of unknown function [Gryllus bimaculatus]
MERRFTYIQPVDSDALEESNRIRMDVTTETEMQHLSSQEDAMSDSSEATLPSSETDAILAIEDGRHASPREEDELSASSEATLPSSEAEAQLPRSEVRASTPGRSCPGAHRSAPLQDAVEVGMGADPEPQASARSPRRYAKNCETPEILYACTDCEHVGVVRAEGVAEERRRVCRRQKREQESRSLPKDGISYNRKAALSSTKVIEWQMNSLPTNPNSPSASKSAGIEGAETDGNSVQISQVLFL